jgi:Porin-like glycoporin RafY
LKLNKLTIACATLLASSAFALDFSANIELDNTYRSGSAVKGTADEGLTQSGRVELNATGKAGANMFVAGKAAFLAKKDGGVATDDMWVQMGTSAVDVKLGRFEAADLFPLPGDTIVNNAGPVYTANTLRGRKAASVFHAAVTGNLGGGLSAELGFIETKAAGESKGVRPAISYANGPLSLRVGVESGKVVGGNDFTGFGGSAAYDFGGFKVTGNLASGKVEAVGGDVKSNSFGLIGSFGPANLGFINGKTEVGGVDQKTTTVYGSYTLPLFDVKGASITPAFSTSKSGANKDNGVRVRINYTF